MTALTGKTIASTYKDLLQISNSNSGIDGTLRQVEDGEGTTSPLELSNSAINLTGTIQIDGVTLTANASALNNIADLTGTTGIVAVSGGNVYGRSIAAQAPLSVTNANGTEGNPTISLVSSGVSTGAYGPMNIMTVDAFGRITDVTATATISADAFYGGTFDGSQLDIENNASIGGNLVVSGTANIPTISTSDLTVNTVSATTKIFSPVVSVTGLHAVSASIADLKAGTLSFDNVSASALTLSNLTVQTSSSFAGVATFTASTTYDSNVNFKDDRTLSFGDSSDLEIIHNGSHSLIRDVGTGNLFIQSNEIQLTNNGSFSMLTLADGQDADFPYGVQVSGTVSASGFVGPTITSINTAITSINTYIVGLSAVMATSIDNSNTAITNLSSTMATSIANSNSAITALSATMATSISNVSSTMATSINNTNTNLTSLSATMATSIDNTNTNLTSLSATMATSIDNTNTNLTALSATMATSIGNHLPLAGGTMTGSLILSGAPSANLEAATKQYVDNLASSAIHFHEAVRVESLANLNATYDNGTAGVGATLTNAGSQAALVIDGITMVVNDRVLVDNQTDQTENGVYTVTNIGSASTNWVLTRATDADSYSPGDNTGLDEGSYFLVTEGNTSEGNAYICSNVGTITFGTTNITFAQFSSSLVYSAGTGIAINDSRVISVSGVPSSAAVAALSATMATSINNTNTNVTNISATFATSINNTNTNVTNLSATFATSINNTNTNVTNLSATLATSISNAAGGSVAFAIALG